MNENESPTEGNGVEIQLFDAAPMPTTTTCVAIENVPANGNECSSVKKTNEDNDFLSQQLSDLNKLLAISEVESVDQSTNEHIVQTKESLRKVDLQPADATSNAMPANPATNNIDDDAENYVKIPVQQLINTFEKQMRSIIKQKVNEKVQLDLNGKFAIAPTTESEPNDGTIDDGLNYGDDLNKSANVEANQETRIESQQQIKQLEQCEQNVRTTSTQQSTNLANEFDTAETSTSTNYNQEFSLEANNVSTYSQFTSNYAYGSCSNAAATATSTATTTTTMTNASTTTLDTLDAILDQNNLQRGKQIYMQFSPSCYFYRCIDCCCCAVFTHPFDVFQIFYSCNYHPFSVRAIHIDIHTHTQATIRVHILFIRKL